MASGQMGEGTGQSAAEGATALTGDFTEPDFYAGFRDGVKVVATDESRAVKTVGPVQHHIGEPGKLAGRRMVP
jgi:hypothetical protein